MVKVRDLHCLIMRMSSGNGQCGDEMAMAGQRGKHRGGDPESY